MASLKKIRKGYRESEELPRQIFHFYLSEDYKTCMLLINFHLYLIYLLLIDKFLKWKNMGNHITFHTTNRLIDSCCYNFLSWEILFIWWLAIWLFIELLTRVSLPAKEFNFNLVQRIRVYTTTETRNLRYILWRKILCLWRKINILQRQDYRWL